MTWLIILWRALVAALAYRAGVQAGVAEAQQAHEIAAAKEQAHVATAVAAAVVDAPHSRGELTDRLRRGEF